MKQYHHLSPHVHHHHDHHHYRFQHKLIIIIFIISVKVMCLYMVGIMLSHVFNRGFPGFESCHGCIAVLFESQLEFNPVHDVHQNSYWAVSRQ